MIMAKLKFLEMGFFCLLRSCMNGCMAKTKMSERKDYSLSKTDVITYKRSRIPRQMQFMILRGPGLNVQSAISDNEAIKKLALRKRFKLKFMQANTNEDVVNYLKDANTWATALIYELGTLADGDELTKKTLKKILIPTIKVSELDKKSSMIEGIENILNSL